MQETKLRELIKSWRSKSWSPSWNDSCYDAGEAKQARIYAKCANELEETLASHPAHADKEPCTFCAVPFNPTPKFCFNCGRKLRD